MLHHRSQCTATSTSLTGRSFWGPMAAEKGKRANQQEKNNKKKKKKKMVMQKKEEEATTKKKNSSATVPPAERNSNLNGMRLHGRQRHLSARPSTVYLVRGWRWVWRWFWRPSNGLLRLKKRLLTNSDSIWVADWSKVFLSEKRVDWRELRPSVWVADLNSSR